MNNEKVSGFQVTSEIIYCYKNVSILLLKGANSRTGKIQSKNSNNAKIFLGLTLIIAIAILLSNYKVYAEEVKIDFSQSPDLILNKFGTTKKNSVPQSTNSLFGPKVVTIKTQDSSFKVLSFSNTVEETLKENAIAYDNNDRIEPKPDTYIGDNYQITVMKVETSLRTEKSTIPFKTILREDKKVYKGVVKTIQKGKNGIMTKQINDIYENGILIRSEIVKQEITTEAVDEIIIKGTKEINMEQSSSCSTWDAVIDQYATGDKNTWMKIVMRCESHCNTESKHGDSFIGLFQFAPSTFYSYGGTDLYNGEDQIRITSKLYDLGKLNKWPACNKKAQAYININ